MATATINGKPSIFISAEPPTDTFPTYRDRVSNFTAIAEGMATEGEVNPNQAEQELAQRLRSPSGISRLV